MLRRTCASKRPQESDVTDPIFVNSEDEVGEGPTIAKRYSTDCFKDGKFKNRFSILKSSDFGNSMDRGYLLAKTMSIALDDALNGTGFVDDLSETSSNDRVTPDWVKAPRDVYHLPEIILSTYSDYDDEADYAMKQMLAVLESLNPLEYAEMFESALQAIQDRLPVVPLKDDGSANWPEVFLRIQSRPKEVDENDTSRSNELHHRLSPAQMSTVFDALPFLIETVKSNLKLSKYLDILYMMVVVTLHEESNIRRQCISAISILLERQILSQEFLKTCIVPGLFHVYENTKNIQHFPTGDLKQETCQALCQLISYDSIYDAQWIFDHFIPPYSRILEDTSMHVRKNALHIFGRLGVLFGEKFSDAFIVPHLLVSCSDLNWAVRKTACECFVEVAKCCSVETRKVKLAPTFAQLLNDPNKWVQLIAYNYLGQFISLFADPAITGLEMKNGKVFVRGVDEPDNLKEDQNDDESNDTIALFNIPGNKFSTLPANTYVPNEGISIDNFNIIRSPMKIETPKRGEQATKSLKRPKRGDTLDSVLSGLNKMLFDRTPSPSTSSSPKSGKEEKSGSTSSVPTSYQGTNSKKSPLSFHSAVSLMDKWSRRNNPNNSQRFQIFEDPLADASSTTNSGGFREEQQQEQEQKDELLMGSGGGGFAARCSSTDDLSKLGLDEDESTACSKTTTTTVTTTTTTPTIINIPALGSSSPSSRKCRTMKCLSPSATSSSSPVRKMSPRGRPVTSTCWTRLDVRQKLFLRRLGALPPSQPSSPKRTSPSPTLQSQQHQNGGKNVFEFDTSPPEDNVVIVVDEKHKSPNALLNEEEEPEEKATSPSSSSIPIPLKTSCDEQVPNEYTLSYWSADCLTDFTDEELKPFGSSTTSPNTNSYLEKRLDVMKQVSPKRVEQLDSSKKKREDLGILDFSDNMSISSNDDDESDEIHDNHMEKQTYKHVPHELVHIYYQIIRQSENMMTMEKSVFEEIYRHCAHNFPAICYTLGKNAWPTLRLMLFDMAKSQQTRVRAAVAYSIHEIAHMFGTEVTDCDLIEIFNTLRDDADFDVRAGIMSNLYAFVKHVSPQKRESMIRALPQFFPVGDEPGNHSENGDWRTRFDLISQLIALCSLYDVDIINLHLSGIALTLADDRVASVRKEAVGLVSKILSVFVSAEWSEITKTRDVANETTIGENKSKGSKTYLSEQFVDDISSSFARTQKWTRRQTFCFICNQVLKDLQLTTQQFAYFFSGQLKNLVKDKVANVRISACDVLDKWRQAILSENENLRNEKHLGIISDTLNDLIDDQDVDTAFFARKYQKKGNGFEEVDVKFRTQRMREREQKYFGDIIYTEANGKTVRVSKNGNIEVIRLPIVPIAEPETEEEFSVLSDSCLDQTICAAEDEEEEEHEGPEEDEPIIEPPTISVEILNASPSDLYDNTECVDMEIEEDDGSIRGVGIDKSTETSDGGKIGEMDESEIPMDPAPSKSIEVAPSSPDSSDA